MSTREDDHDRRIAGLMLFMLGGLTGTFLALRWSRQAGAGRPNTVERIQALLDESVESVESAATYVRTLVEPVHGMLDELNTLASGVRRTLDSYRQLGKGGAATPQSAAPYVPSMAPETPPVPAS